MNPDSLDEPMDPHSSTTSRTTVTSTLNITYMFAKIIQLKILRVDYLGFLVISFLYPQADEQ